MNDKIHVTVSSTQSGSSPVSFSPFVQVNALSAFPGFPNYCGAGGEDNCLWTVLQVKHSASDLKIEIIGDMNVGSYFALNNINTLYSVQTIDENWAWVVYYEIPLASYSASPATSKTVTLSCDTSCQNGCFGPLPTDCFWCSAGYLYNGNECTTCAIGTYPPTCTSCPAGCSACASPSICTSCASTGYYYNNFACPPCDPTCLTCSGGAQDQCLSCPSGSILYPNNTCITSSSGGCELPYVQITVNSQPTCQFPCSGKSPYAFEDGTCTSQCPPSYSVKLEGSNLVCVFEDSLDFAVQNASRKAIIGLICITLLVINAIIDPKSFIPLSIAILMKMLEYIKYIDVSHSDQLELFLSTSKRSILDLFVDTDAPSHIKDKIATYPIPFVFSRYRLVSSFLVNFWEDLNVFAVLTGIFIFSASLKPIVINHKRIHFIFTKLKIAIQNILVTYIYHNVGDTILFAGLEFRSTWRLSGLTILSIVLTFFLICISSSIYALNVWLIRKKRRILKQKNTQELQTFNKQYEGFRVLFEDLKEQSLFQYSFLIFFVSRDFLLSLLLVILFKYPFIEAIVILVMNISMLAYLFITRPLKERLQEVQQICCELILLVVNVSILILAIHDHRHSGDQHLVEVFGKIIIIANVAFIIAVFFYLIVVVAWKYHHRPQKEASKTETPSQLKRAGTYSKIEVEPQSDYDTSSPEKMNTKLKKSKVSHFSESPTDDKISLASQPTVAAIPLLKGDTKLDRAKLSLSPCNDSADDKISLISQSTVTPLSLKNVAMRLDKNKITSFNDTATDDKLSPDSKPTSTALSLKNINARLDKAKVYPFNDVSESRISLVSPRTAIDTPLNRVDKKLDNTKLSPSHDTTVESLDWNSPKTIVPMKRKNLRELAKSSIFSASQSSLDSKDKQS